MSTKKPTKKQSLQSSNGAAHKSPSSLKAVAEALNKKLGVGTVILGDTNIVKVDAIPTGIASLDAAVGIGGIPRGRMIEIYGAESSGKTTTTLQIIASCQNTYFEQYGRYGVCAFIDAEHALDPTWAKSIGVDIDNIIFNQPEFGEQAFQVIEELANSRAVDLVIVDSLASLVPKEEIDGELDATQVGAQARMVSKALRRIKGKVKDANMAVVFVNQIRLKVGVMFGNPEDTPGGKSLKFYASIRIDLRRGDAIHTGGKKQDGDKKTNMGAIGMTTKVKVVKNKVARPFRQCEYGIYFGTSPGGDSLPISGIDTIGSLFDAASAIDVVTMSGSTYYYDSGRLGSGRLQSLQTLRGNSDLQGRIRADVLAHYAPVDCDVRRMDAEELVEHLQDEDLVEPEVDDESQPAK